jgi:hypothetical protein
MKLKSWGYEKYLSSADKKILVAKADKRTREEGKNTAFFHRGSEIQPNKIECFKKRKMTNFVEAVSPSAGKSCTVCDIIEQILTDQQKLPQTLRITLLVLKAKALKLRHPRTSC